MQGFGRALRHKESSALHSGKINERTVASKTPKTKKPLPAAWAGLRQKEARQAAQGFHAHNPVQGVIGREYVNLNDTLWRVSIQYKNFTQTKHQSLNLVQARQASLETAATPKTPLTAS
jgi:hypothetical protein